MLSDMHSVILFPCILYRNIRLVEAYKVLPLSKIRPLVTFMLYITPSKLDIELCTLRLLSIGIFASLCPSHLKFSHLFSLLGESEAGSIDFQSEPYQ